MFPIPQIRIQTTPARLRVDTDLGQYEIRQPRPSFELRQPRAKLELEQPPAKMDIDQSKAWDALALANHLEVAQRIYSQAREIALKGIGKIAERGDRLADITKEPDAISNMASEDMTVTFPELAFAGEAAYDNVDIVVERQNPIIESTPSSIELTARTNAPEIQYTRGKTDIQVAQYAKVVITPPVIDLRL